MWTLKRDESIDLVRENMIIGNVTVQALAPLLLSLLDVETY